MEQQTALDFFFALMRNANIRVSLYAPDAVTDFDMGLRRALSIDMPDLSDAVAQMKDKTIYQVEDVFLCRYLALRLPGSGDVLNMGPYLSDTVSEQTMMTILEKLKCPPAMLGVMRQFYRNFPIISSDSSLLIAVNTLGEMLWGGKDAFTYEGVSTWTNEGAAFSLAGQDVFDAERPDMELVERSYEHESELLYAIAHGQIHRANAMLSAFNPAQVDQRSTSQLRNTKNYAIISNTLMRKAVQQGGVHPYYIDQLSSSLARRIEQAMTVEEVHKLILTMAHKYCLLVKNYNTKDYSQPVQRVMLRTDAEIAGDLSLSAHARHIGINASYLSALFKKETGMTLTEYVNSRRVEYAIFLLNSTNMQIQTIAQHCGMTDVNYFTRTFRRVTGKTPTEYRQSIAMPT